MLITRFIKRVWNKGVFDLGAQVTFYLVLAFFPFIMLLLNLLSYTPLADPVILGEIAWMLPENTFHLVATVIDELTLQGNLTILSFGALGSLFIATRGIFSLQKALNVSYDVIEKRPFPLQILLSIFLTFVLLVSINVSFVVLVLGQIAGNYMEDFLELPEDFMFLWNAVRYGFSLLILIVILSILYAGLPNKKLSFRNVWPGAVFTTAGWIFTSMLFSFYVNRFATYSYIYGSLGAVFVLFLWLYLFSVVFLAGGELNALLYEKYHLQERKKQSNS